MTRCRCRKKREESFLVVCFVFQFICEKINRQNDFLLFLLRRCVNVVLVSDNKRRASEVESSAMDELKQLCF